MEKGEALVKTGAFPAYIINVINRKSIGNNVDRFCLV